MSDVNARSLHIDLAILAADNSLHDSAPPPRSEEPPGDMHHPELNPTNIHDMVVMTPGAHLEAGAAEQLLVVAALSSVNLLA